MLHTPPQTRTHRRPKAALRPFVVLVWASDGVETPMAAAGQELVLPTGAMHIVLRLNGGPMRLLNRPGNSCGYTVGNGLIGGVRPTAYCKELSAPGATVGAVLRPGTAELLSGTPAGFLAGRHTSLEDVWGRAVVMELQDRLEATPTPADRLDLFESFLSCRLPTLRGLDPLIANALVRLGQGCSVQELVAESGFSHRYIAQRFSESIGIPPKSYGRLLRFHRTLGRIRSGRSVDLADVAFAEGYADQAHMTRDFRSIAGITPGQYIKIAPVSAHHIPLQSSG